MTQVFYILDHILSSHLPNREIFFVPVLNVEGLAAICEEFKTQHKVLEIRKNMRPSSCSITSRGVDLNRNYGYKWGYDSKGSSSDPCSEEYRGESEFSELETQAIKNLIEIYRFDSVISYHSYGDMYIRPTGYAQNSMSGFPIAHQGLYNEIKKNLPKEFRFGSVQELLEYNANGSLMDYLYSLGVFIIEIEIGPEHFFSFHPNINNVEQILKSHLKPFEIIYNYTASHLVAGMSNSGRNVKVEVENKGLAIEYSKELVIEVANSTFEYKMVSEHKVRKVGKAIFIELPNLLPMDKVDVELVIYCNSNSATVNGYFWPKGEIDSGFSNEIDFKVGQEKKHVVKVIVVVFVVACLLVLIGLVYLCVSTRKNDLEFVEMVEIIPSVPV